MSLSLNDALCRQRALPAIDGLYYKANVTPAQRLQAMGLFNKTPGGGFHWLRRYGAAEVRQWFLKAGTNQI